MLKALFLQENEPHGVLTVWEGKENVPFEISRVFTVVANAGGLRGEHAHKQCLQAIFCVAGKILLKCDDGLTKTEDELIPDGKGVLVPNGVWAEQHYLEDNTMILVLCDKPYDESDYLRNYKEFLKWKGLGN